MRQLIDRLWQEKRGIAALELAITAPLLLAMLMGIMAFGGYFWLAHGLQQTANDAARAAIAGLTATERGSIARSLIASDLARIDGIDPTRATTAIADDGQTITIRLSYDASNTAFLKLGFVALPSPTIVRVAAVRLGGM